MSVSQAAAAANTSDSASTASFSAPDVSPRYFKKDLVVFKNLDVFRSVFALSLDRSDVLTHPSCRSTDLSLVLLLSYAFLSATLFHKLSPGGALFCHFVHALGWRVFHSFGLGTLLKKQSENRWLVRHFLKHYAYPAGEDGAVQDAFTNWKATYNLSLSMTYGEPSSNRPIYLSRADRLDILLQLRSLVLPGRPTPFLPTGPLEANSFDTLSVS